jgi:hypothetical protein
MIGCMTETMIGLSAASISPQEQMPSTILTSTVSFFSITKKDLETYRSREIVL